MEWLDHAISLGASGIALGPVFASRTHGYDTTDHYRIDPRLGDDADFDRLGFHTDSGRYTLDDWLRIYTAHATDHADQIGRALRGEA